MKSAVAIVSLAFVFVAGGAQAQVNTAGFRGQVVSSNGTPIADAAVVLIHDESASTRSTVSNDAGEFAFTGLRVGGPYSASVEAPGFLPQGLIEIYLEAGKNQRVTVTLAAASEVIEIEGTSTPTSTSQKVAFGAREIADLPTFGRDPKEVVRIMPEAYLDGDNQSLSVGGANNRFNSITIDGIRQDDDFGLNASGYPTARSPISLGAVEEISVQRSPFDVRYGSFLGGNINIVTKSGTNQFHGSVLGTFANQGLVGSDSGDEQLEIEFRDARYGVNVGGPIVRDRLYFFFSAEGLDATSPSSVGPEGSGAANEIASVTQTDVDRVRDIAGDVYGFDAGVPSRTLSESDLKLLAKVDWEISPKHRLSAKYQRSGGNSITPSAAFGTTLPLTSNWYDRKDTLNAFSLRGFSTWNPSLSTEFEVSGKLVSTRQDPLSGNDFMTAEIATADGGTIVIGPDEFRHANELDNDLLHLKGELNYLWKSHLITAGWEMDRLWVFNLFVPSSNGVAEYSSIDAFENMQPSAISYSNSVTNVAEDAAANWGHTVQALYVQDQYEITPELTAQGGFRTELYWADDNISANGSFADRNGFENTATINGLLLAMPRAGVTYRPIPRLNLRGGAGLYSGGTPNVWISNNYTNDGVSIDSAFSNDPTATAGFNGRDIPSELTGQLEPGDGNVDALDPDFKIPSTWKLAAGADYSLDIPGLGEAGKSLGLELNYEFGKVRDGLMWQDLRRYLDDDQNLAVGRLPDGRPFFDFDGSDGSTFNERRGFDMLLTNTDQGYSHTASVSVNKGFPFGLWLYGAYAYQHVMEINPANSSRSVSNYGLVAATDPNFPVLATSNYERAHRFVGVLRYSRPLVADIVGPDSAWKGMATVFSLFAESRSGQPFSYTFADDSFGTGLARLFGEEREFARRNRQLFYVPSGDGSDVMLNGIDQDELDAFLEESGLDKYRGKIAPRNAFRSRWLNRFDLRLAQEIPSAVAGQKGRLFLDIQNVANLLNSSWGVSRQVPFPFMVPVVDVSYDPTTERYVYSNLRTSNPQVLNLLASVWRIQVTLMYEF